MAEAASIVIPQLGEGNGGDLNPFGIPSTNASMRYQQVYDASQFSQAPSGGWVTEIDFRVDSTTGYGFSTTLDNLQINLSTTVKAPDSLSPVFSANVGNDDTVVFGPGRLNMSSGFSPFSQPQAFEIKIALFTPFLYNPIAGNLLLDVRNYEGNEGLPTFPPAFDLSGITNDSVSRIYADSVNAISATQVDTYGLVTQFEISFPRLTIWQATNSVVVAWDRGFKAFDLQSADSLGPQTRWQLITNGIATNAFYQWYTVPLSSGKPAQYFRLSCPVCRGANGATQEAQDNGSIKSISREGKD